VTFGLTLLFALLLLIIYFREWYATGPFRQCRLDAFNLSAVSDFFFKKVALLSVYP